MPKITQVARDVMIADCLKGLPLEACGLLLGAGDEIAEVFPARNEAASARLYTVDSRDLLFADRRARSLGLDVIGVYHSHTHSEAYPSPTDVAQAPDPNWHYIIVSLRREIPEIRCFEISEGKISEAALVVKVVK